MASTELIEQVLPKTSSCYTEAYIQGLRDASGRTLRDYVDGKGRGYTSFGRSTSDTPRYDGYSGRF